MSLNIGIVTSSSFQRGCLFLHTFSYDAQWTINATLRGSEYSVVYVTSQNVVNFSITLNFPLLKAYFELAFASGDSKKQKQCYILIVLCVNKQIKICQILALTQNICTSRTYRRKTTL